MFNFRYWRSHAKSHGTWRTVKCLGHRATNHIVPHATLVCVSITAADVDPQFLQVPLGFEARFLSARDVNALVQQEEMGVPAKFARSALNKGDRCYALLDANGVVSFGWYSHLPTAIDDDLMFVFDPSYVYMYFGYTLPAYRGKRLHAVGMAKALEQYTREQCCGLISFVESNNFASLRSCERMGYKQVGRIFTTRFGGHRWIHASKECDSLRIRVVPRADSADLGSWDGMQPPGKETRCHRG